VPGTERVLERQGDSMVAADPTPAANSCADQGYVSLLAAD
jgi:hypothetical protein